MVWVGMSLHCLHNLTTARYQHEVLDTVISLLRNHRGMQLLHDGTLANWARVTAAYLNAKNVNVIDSPLLNSQTLT